MHVPLTLIPAARTELSEDAAREIINRWNDQRYFHIKYLGDKIFIKGIVPFTAYTVQLRSQYEDRSVRQASVAFAGGYVDQAGKPPGPWEVPVQQPTDFEKRTEQLPIPHTDRVQMCPECVGQGQLGCPQCSGSGRSLCMWCRGTGYRQRPEFRTERDPMGNMVTRQIFVSERCSCDGGRVTCGTCGGNGRVVCSSCEGSGRVKVFDQLTVRFRPVAQQVVLDPTDVPDNEVARMTGDTIFNQRADLIESVPSFTPELDRQIQELLQKARADAARQTRLLFQHLHVERVHIHEVTYQYAGVDRRLWVCGKEEFVHAPHAPYQRGKLFGILAGVGLAVAALAAVLVYFLTR